MGVLETPLLEVHIESVKNITNTSKTNLIQWGSVSRLSLGNKYFKDHKEQAPSEILCKYQNMLSDKNKMETP